METEVVTRCSRREAARFTDDDRSGRKRKLRGTKARTRPKHVSVFSFLRFLFYSEKHSFARRSTVIHRANERFGFEADLRRSKLTMTAQASLEMTITMIVIIIPIKVRAMYTSVQCVIARRIPRLRFPSFHPPMNRPVVCLLAVALL